MGRNLDPIWIDTFFYNGKKTAISNIQHPFGKLSLLFRIGSHDSHVDMKTKNCNMLSKMRSRQQNTNNVFSSSLGNNRQDLLKIPTKDHVFPPKIFSVACASSNCQITQSSINSFESSAMHHRCLIPNDQISFTHQLGHFHLLCDVTNQLIVQINWNLEWFYRPETTKMQFLMRQLQARFCLALVNETKALSKQMFCRFHHCHTQKTVCHFCSSRHSK